MDKRFWAVILAIGLIFVGIIWVNKEPADAPGTANGKSSAQATNHVKGENAKNVTLVEYGDFQCPSCYQFEPTVQQVYAKYQKDIKFQFRNFPLQQAHPNAFAAARAAEAAGKQDKFWEMHDLLYQNQTSWASSSDPLSDFEQYAKTAGVADTAKFKADFTNKSVNDAINADIREGNKIKVDGTPSFYLNGTKIDNGELFNESGQPDIEKFSKFIDAEIAKQAKKQ